MMNESRLTCKRVMSETRDREREVVGDNSIHKQMSHVTLMNASPLEYI